MAGDDTRSLCSWGNQDEQEQLIDTARERGMPPTPRETSRVFKAKPVIKATTGMFGPLALFMHFCIVFAYGMVEYDMSMATQVDSSSIYNYYVGVALMMFVGFGYLMTFLKAYGLGAVGLTMFVTCLGVEWAVLIETLMSSERPVKLDFMDLLNGNFAVAAVLISFGGLIGKVSPSQLLVVTIIELVCYCGNKVFILTDTLHIADCGGTIIIHVFGAYFGLACCFAIGPAKNEDLNGSSYNSDLFSLIGTVFLWLFWPSFVAGALPQGPSQELALVNTVLALLASTVVTFGIMPMLNEERLGTVPVQNATLAGGVAIGATANLAMRPQGAFAIGSIAGAVSCFGFVHPLISSSYDTCGINNLHGMPGILGGVMSAVAPIMIESTGVKPRDQLLGLLVTLLVATCTGYFTGLLIKLMPSPPEPFDDETFWDCADDKPTVKIFVPPKPLDKSPQYAPQLSTQAKPPGCGIQ